MVDTDVLIWVLRGKSEAIAWLEGAARDGNLLCSVLTVSELFRMVRRAELRKTETLLDALHVVPVLYEDARRAADLMREHGPGTPLSPDGLGERKSRNHAELSV